MSGNNSISRNGVLVPFARAQHVHPGALETEAGSAVIGPEGGPVSMEMQSAVHNARGKGEPLDGSVSEKIGAWLRYDFSVVRVHTGPEPDRLSSRLGARAFTIGSDIFFARGAYEPASPEGRELIAHELVHVMQQGSGRVSGVREGMAVSSAGDESEQQAGAFAAIAAMLADLRSPVHHANRVAPRSDTSHAEGISPARRVASAPQRIQRALANQAVVMPAQQGLSGHTCAEAVWYWAAMEAEAKGRTNPKDYATRLGGISVKGGGPTAEMLKVKRSYWDLSKGFLPSPGTVLLWKEPRFHVAVVVAGGLIAGYNQGRCFDNIPSNNYCAMGIADLKDEAKKCFRIYEETMVKAAAKRKL